MEFTEFDFLSVHETCISNVLKPPRANKCIDICKKKTSAPICAVFEMTC